ncbi:surface-adhesin E family protein [Acinetobacter junii]|uniref:surface-adhesin E family protein n=1 Tax=Acinetobacter junii TaxID=40215 RepID=UPI0012505F45|nr:surface-adhesin E family protein [Acinetobacter junii]
MKKLILISSLLISSFSSGADWKYASMGSHSDRAIYVDSSQYDYDYKNNTIKTWFKTDSYEDENSKKIYTRSKKLHQFSCLDKKAKILAYVEYDKDGGVTSSAQRESKDAKYELVVPDTVGEDLWKVSCASKGGGFRYPEYQTGERLTKEEMEKIFPNGTGGAKEYTQEERNELNKRLSAQ